MAKPRITRRLKVYRTRIGFHDWLVAVPNQKDALKAWDVRENLFATGAASTVSDPDLIEAATATPGVPIKAPGQPRPEAPVIHPRKTRPKPKAPPPAEPARANVVRLEERRRMRTEIPAPHRAKHKPPPPPPDRTKLDAAEREREDFEREIAIRRKELDKRKRALDLEIDEFESDAAHRRRALEKRVEKETAIFNRAKNDR